MEASLEAPVHSPPRASQDERDPSFPNHCEQARTASGTVFLDSLLQISGVSHIMPGMLERGCEVEYVDSASLDVPPPTQDLTSGGNINHLYQGCQ